MRRPAGHHRQPKGDSARQGTCLGLLSGHPAHVLGVQLHGVIAQLGFGSCFEVVAAHGKVTVPLHPPGNEKEQKPEMILRRSPGTCERLQSRTHHRKMQGPDGHPKISKASRGAGPL